MREIAALLFVSVVLGPCSKEDKASPAGSGSAAASAAPAASAPPVAAKPRKPGEMPAPFDFPSGATTAKAGDWVLVPSGGWIDEAFTKGGDKQTFIYYAATMVAPGPVESKVKSQTGSEFTAPNAFIIPIKSGQKGKVGDIVLTWWQTGSGMQRSIVVAGGSEDEPKVLHLDMDLDNPTKQAEKPDTLKKNTFHKLSAGLEPGITVGCKDGSKTKRWTVTSVSPDKLFVIGFAGSMAVVKKSDCTAIPPSATFAVGKDASIPWSGSYYQGKVDKVDAKIGRVFVKINPFEEKIMGVGVQDVSSAPLGQPSKK